MLCTVSKIIRIPDYLCYTATEVSQRTKKRYLNNKSAQKDRSKLSIDFLISNDDDLRNFDTFFKNLDLGANPFAIDITILGHKKTAVVMLNGELIEKRDSSFAHKFSIGCTILRIDNEWDKIPPVITILGDNPIDIVGGGTYVDEGATAYDNIEGDISGNILTTSTVNLTEVGQYDVTYMVQDNYFNKAVAKRIVNVTSIVDTLPPVITLLGNMTDSATLHNNYFRKPPVQTSYIDVVDNGDGTATYTVNTAGTNKYCYIRLSKTGNYGCLDMDIEAGKKYGISIPISDVSMENDNLRIISYDWGRFSSDVTADGIFNFRNKETDGDITSYIKIGSNGDDVVGDTWTIDFRNIKIFEEYVDEGATSYDNIDGDITNNIVIGGDVVDIMVEGTYNITYNVSDAAGNAADEVTRTVNVIDTSDNTAPIITLLGDPSITIYEGNTYVDAGATATDDVDGDITSYIVVTNNVDTNTVGNYNVLYNVSDSSGNVADTVTRSVEVVAVPSGTVEFGTVGTTQWTVPDGVSSITVCAIAAGGSGANIYDNEHYNGAGGGYAGQIYSSTVSVTPGEVLDISIGAGGAQAFGYANNGYEEAGHAGGNTTISRGGTAIVSCNGGNGGNLTSSKYDATYAGNKGTQPQNCSGTFTDGRLFEHSAGVNAYGGQAGLANAYQGTARDFESGLKAMKGTGGTAGLGGGSTIGSEGGGDGFIRISWG